MKTNKERNRRLGLYALILFLLSLIIGCSTLFLGGSSSSSSGSSSVASSLTPSSSTPTTSSTPTSSTETSTSQTPSSSTPSSSTPSSEVVNGPRLTLLQPEGTLKVLGGTLIDSTHYFVTQDDTSVYLSGFNGNTLVFQHFIGAGSQFFMIPAQSSIVPYHEGLFFSYYIDFAPETVYVNASGVQETLANVQILPSTNPSSEEGLYAVDSTTGNKLLQFTAPSLVPVMVGNLTSTVRYSYVTHEINNANTTIPTTIPSTFLTFGGFDTSTNKFVFEFFNKATLAFVLSHSPQDNVMGKELMISVNGVTLLDSPQQKVTHYTADGVDFELTGVIPFSYAANEAFMVNVLSTGATSVYKDATLLQTFSNGSIIPLTNNELDGTSFVVNYFNGSSEIYAIEATLNLLGAFSTSQTAVITTSDVPPQAITYDEASLGSTVFMYSTSRYGESNYVSLDFVGDLRNAPIQYYITVEDASFGVQFVEGEPTDANSVPVSTNQNSQLNTYTIENKNIVNVRDVGQVDEFIILNAALGSTSTYRGIVMNVSDGTIYEFDTDLTLVTPQLGDSILPTIVREGQRLHVYGIRGIITLDLDTVSVTVHDTTDGVTATINYFIQENFFPNQDALVIKFIEPFPNTNFTATASFYQANFSLGFDDFVLLGEGTLDTLTISNSLFSLSEDTLVQINLTTGELFSVFAPNEIVATPYYILNDEYYLLTDTLEEINTYIPTGSVFTLF